VVVPVDIDGNGVSEFLAAMNFVVDLFDSTLLATGPTTKFTREELRDPSSVVLGGLDGSHLWAATTLRDSLYLSDIPLGRRRLVTTGRSNTSSGDMGVGPREVVVSDLRDTGRLEALVSVGAWGGPPRGVYALDWATGASLWRYETGPGVYQMLVRDVDGDSKREVAVSTAAYGDGNEANGTSASLAYLLLLNSDGTRRWIRPLGKYSSSLAMAWLDDSLASKQRLVLARESNPEGGNKLDSLWVVDAANGDILDSLGFAGLNTHMAVLRNAKREALVVVSGRDGTLRLFDSKLRLRRTQQTGSVSCMLAGSFTAPGRAELAVATRDNRISILDERLGVRYDLELGMNTSIADRMALMRRKDVADLLIPVKTADGRVNRCYRFSIVPFWSRSIATPLVFGGAAVLLLAFGFVLLSVRYQQTRDIRSVIRSLTGRAGTIELNRRGEVTGTNQKARELLGTREKRVTQIPTQGPFASIAELARAMLTEPEGTPPRELAVSVAPGQTSMVRCVRVKTGAVLTIEDISAVEYLQRVKAWAPVAQKLAHGIKNPLNTILGSVEQIELKVTDEKALKYMGYVKDEVTRLRKMSDAFMRFTKLNPPALQPKNVNDVVRKAVSKFEGRTTNAGIGLKLELDEKLPAIALDEEGFSNALEIVIENAVEAMSEVDSRQNAADRVLSIRTSREVPNSPASSVSSVVQDCIRIEIADTGKGIPAKYLEKVFEPYFTMGKPQGTGLGLALAKKIVEDHHGQMAITSQEGAGTQVSILLPVKA
jgi:nitrogen-specific signal transduction histidine kinase